MRHSGTFLWATALSFAALSLAFAKTSAPAFPPAEMHRLLSMVGVVNVGGVNYKLDGLRVASEGEWLVIHIKPKRVE